MAYITLTFANPLPEGIQVGDIAWYLNVSSNINIQMGPIVSITNDPTTILINAGPGVVPPSTNDFVYYVKNPIAYLGQLKGYYAEAQFRNNSSSNAELFSVGSEVFESSK